MTVETSIIIRTFNEERHLPALFDALDRQSHENFETLVIDSGSTDRTRTIADDRADRLIRISSHDFTFGYSLNAGIRAAAGRFIAIVSAHTIPCEDSWLEKLIAPLRDEGEKIAMTYGRQFGVQSSKFSEAEDLRRMFGAVPRNESADDFRVNNANAAIRRDLWQDHPFDEELTGLEDIEWARYWMGQGHQVNYVPDAALLHIHQESWRQIERRFYREAVAMRRMSIRGRRHLVAILGREMVLTASDLCRAMGAGENPAAARMTIPERWSEIIRYRLAKNIGIVTGKLKSHPLETRQEQEDILFDRTTDAVVISGPGHARLERVAIPEIRPGEVLIRVAHVAVCATDLEIHNGTLGYYANGMASYPVVPGHEFSGEIVAAGANTDGVNEGDRVVVECIQSCGSCADCKAGNFIGCAERKELGVLGLNGAYAGYVVTPARFVHRIADGTSLKAAALAEPLAVVLKGLRRIAPMVQATGSKPRWAVIGAGPLGHLFAKVLSHQGHAVTGFDRDPDRRALLAQSQIDTDDDLSRLSEFDAIIEVTGDPDVLDTALRESRANALLLLIGLPYGNKSFSFETVAAYDKTVIGSVGSTAEDFEAAIRLLPALDLDAYFQCPMKLSDFKAGWEKSREGKILKVMLEPD
jgi:2-desacetyl-2-hydroxyethyl bacteriochlorophyllide A dehydrogenase